MGGTQHEDGAGDHRLQLCDNEVDRSRLHCRADTFTYELKAVTLRATAAHRSWATVSASGLDLCRRSARARGDGGKHLARYRCDACRGILNFLNHGRLDG